MLILRFVRESQQKVDYYQSVHYLSKVADRWLAVRLETVGGLIIFFAALFAVMARETISPGLAGLSISYTLEVSHHSIINVFYHNCIHGN